MAAEETSYEAGKWVGGAVLGVLSAIGLVRASKARAEDRTNEILRRLDALETVVETLQSDVFKGQSRDEHVANELTLIRQALNGIRYLLENQRSPEYGRERERERKE